MDASGKILGMIAMIVVLIAGLALTPTIIDQVENATGASDTWNFTGAEGAASLLGLIPFVWIASILIAVVVGMFILAKQS